MTMPRAVRHINEMRVLEVVLRNGRISRANIAKELGLTRSTASSIVASLADEGLLVEDNSEEDKGAGTGRPGTFLRLNAKHSLFIGADIGVGRMSIVALDLDAKLIEREEITFGSENVSAELAVETVVAGVRRLQSRIDRGYTPRGLCVTVPGIIDKTGKVIRAPFLGWHNEPILERLNQQLPEFPILISENDANAFAFADAFHGRVESADTEIYLFLDAGVGGAIIRRGEIMRGNDGYAGEFGHVILGDAGFAKLTTPSGSVESFIGQDAILARFRHHGGNASDFAAFLDAATRKEQPAALTLSDWAFYVGRTIAMIESIFNPTTIVLGGRVASLFSLCEETVFDNIRRNLMDDQPLPRVHLSRLGIDGPAIGGALILHRQTFSLDEGLVFRKKLAARA